MEVKLTDTQFSYDAFMESLGVAKEEVEKIKSYQDKFTVKEETPKEKAPEFKDLDLQNKFSTLLTESKNNVESVAAIDEVAPIDAISPLEMSSISYTPVKPTVDMDSAFPERTNVGLKQMLIRAIQEDDDKDDDLEKAIMPTKIEDEPIIKEDAPSLETTQEIFQAEKPDIPFQGYTTNKNMEILFGLEGEGDEVTDVKTGYSGITESAEKRLGFKNEDGSFVNNEFEFMSETTPELYAVEFYKEYMKDIDKRLVDKGVNLEGLKNNERQALFFTLVNADSMLSNETEWFKNLKKASKTTDEKKRIKYIKLHTINLLDAINAEGVPVRGLANRRAFEYNLAKDRSQKQIERVSIRPIKGKGYSVAYFAKDGTEIFEKTFKDMQDTDSIFSLKSIINKRNYFDYVRDIETGRFKPVPFKIFAQKDYEKNNLELAKLEQEKEEKEDV
jgi:hypothetical protein